jgi:hypothetical protein
MAETISPQALQENIAPNDLFSTWNPVDTLHPRTGYSWYRWEHS